MSRLGVAILLIFVSLVGYGQGLYNNGANIVITSGTDVYIDGDNSGNYLTASNGEVDVQSGGELILEGDWTNNNGSDNAVTNTATTGWIRFEGNSSTGQVVGGTAATTFPYLEFNNSNGISLSQNAITPGKLELTSGVVTTGSNRLEMTSTTTGDLITYSNTAFVFGNLRRYIAANTSTYVLPIGDGTASTDYYRADFINNNSTGTSYLDASVAAITESGNNVDSRVVATEDGTPFVDVKGEQAIWSLIPDATTSPNYGLNLYTANISGLVDDKFSIVKRTDASTDYADWDSFDGSTTIPSAGAVGRTVAGGYAQKTGFTSFSKFAIAMADFVLPIELYAFKSECVEGAQLISWKTLSEINVSHFEIEKSYDGVNFFQLELVSAYGTSSSIQNYAISDNNNETSSVYYRLTAIDFDGTKSAINIIRGSECEDKTFDIQIFENRGVNEVNMIVVTEQSEEFTLTIVDAMGKLIFIERGSVTNGLNQFQFGHHNLATGTYFMTYMGSRDNIYTQKLFIH